MDAFKFASRRKEAVKRTYCTVVRSASSPFSGNITGNYTVLYSRVCHPTFEHRQHSLVHVASAAYRTVYLRRIRVRSRHLYHRITVILFAYQNTLHAR